MRVRMLMGPYAGQILDEPDRVAENLLQCGMAERALDEPEAPELERKAAPLIENATVAPPENAMMPKSKPRRSTPSKKGR